MQINKNQCEYIDKSNMNSFLSKENKKINNFMFKNHKRLILLILKEFNAYPFVNLCKNENIMKQFENLQKSYWFYIDNFYNTNTNVMTDNNKTPSFKSFLLNLSTTLGWSVSFITENLKNYWKHSSSISRCGGILLNEDMDKILLVRGFGGKKWNFPSGKNEPSENKKDTAIREVFEETGYKASYDTVSTLPFFEFKRKKAQYSLFIFFNVPNTFQFQSQSKYEIEEIKWFPVHNIHNIMNVHIKKVNKIQNMINNFKNKEKEKNQLHIKDNNNEHEIIRRPFLAQNLYKIMKENLVF
jgi:8-oxo-dGTP pyrophosphatase MutT (NUDIX family)